MPEATSQRHIFPGDVLSEDAISKYQRGDGDVNMEEDDQGTVLKIGPGLVQTEGSDILAARAGLLHYSQDKKADHFWIESNSKRYIPSAGELVLGIITHRLAETYRVDIASSHPALLGHLAFEGATKRNKPNLKVGTVVYARVSLANKDMDPELECVHPETSKADGLGDLSNEGSLLPYRISLGLARRLLNPTSEHPDVLALLGQKISFECCVGMNGRVWVRAKNPKHIIAVMLAIQQAEQTTDPQALRVLVRDVTRKYL